MKMKSLALGVLSLVGLVLSSSNASAFFLFPQCFHHDCSVIVCRPYNAFTPICCGTMMCNGCCPSFCGGGGCARQTAPAYPTMFTGGICCDSSCPVFEGTCAATPGMMMQAPSTPSMTPMPTAPSFTPPAPTPSPVFNQTSMRRNVQGNGVQPAGYNPAYPMNYYPTTSYPTNYYPAANYPMAPAMPVPSYWYNTK